MAAPPEPLRGRRGLPELREMLRRQQSLLGHRTFISRLPDKGKKASAFAEKLKAAIAQEEEAERRAALLSTVRLAFRERQEGLAAHEDNPAREDSPQAPASHVNEALGSAVQDQPDIWATQTRARNEPEPAQQACGDSGTPQEKESASRAPAPSGAPHESADRSSEALTEALGRMAVGGREHEGGSGKELGAESREDPFWKVPQQPPHGVEVLERRAKDSAVGKKKSPFKPNRIPAEQGGSSHSSSEAPSPGGGRWSLSDEERRRREKQHLDDITAARLPALRHAPAQLLPLEESVALQVQQKAAYEEKQARLAAQKLAQKLGLQVAAYEPEGEVGVHYREVRDENGYSSAED